MFLCFLLFCHYNFFMVPFVTNLLSWIFMNLYNNNHLLIGHGQIYSDLPTNSFFCRLSVLVKNYTAQKMNFFINDFFIKCDWIRRKQRILSHLQKKSKLHYFLRRVNIEHPMELFEPKSTNHMLHSLRI